MFPTHRTQFSVLGTLVFAIACSAANAPGARAANFLVTSTADNDGGNCEANCTLRQAIKASNASEGADTIAFDASVFNEPKTITLGGTQLVIGGDVSIEGPSSARVTINGAGASRVLLVEKGTVTLRRVTIRGGGKVEGGGGINNGGTLTLLDSTFIGNGATSFGGAIQNRTTLTINNCNFENNSAPRNGGAIDNSFNSVANLRNCQFSGNTSGDGGGINNTGTIEINDCSFTSNRADAFGGAVRNFKKLTVNDSTFSRNTAANGGGIDSDDAGNSTLNNCTFANNTANNSGGGIGDGGRLTIINSTLTGNTANRNGGGINGIGTLQVLNCTLANNSATLGGGLYADESALLSNSTVAGNVASGSGGGVYSGSLTMTNSTIAGNSAPQGSGVAAFGSGTAVTRLSNSIVAGNSSNNDVSVVDNATALVSGGYNLIGGGNAVARFNATGDQSGINDPQLGSLTNNGGPTPTRALLEGSPAIDAGNPNIAATSDGFDQRGPGFARVQGGRIDIGAFERATAITPPPSGTLTAVNDDYTLALVVAGESQQTGVVLQSNGIFRIDAPGVLANDRNPAGGAVTASAISRPEHGRFLLRGDGTLFYLPNSGFTGVDEFSYVIRNGQNSSQARVRLTIVDQRAPEMRFDTPPNRATVKAVTRIAGRVRDRESGIKGVTLLWQRFDGAYWNGSEWTSRATQLPLNVEGINWNYRGPLPAPGDDPARSLLDGRYDLTATATDNSGNTNQIINRIAVKNQTTPPPPIEPPATASSVRLSSATAIASQGAILLNFTGALDAASAGDKTNYRVRVNEIELPIGNAFYANNTVTLGGLSLNAGDRIVLHIDALRDASGKIVPDGTIQVVAR